MRRYIYKLLAAVITSLMSCVTPVYAVDIPLEVAEHGEYADTASYWVTTERPVSLSGSTLDVEVSTNGAPFESVHSTTSVLLSRSINSLPCHTPTDFRVRLITATGEEYLSAVVTKTYRCTIKEAAASIGKVDKRQPIEGKRAFRLNLQASAPDAYYSNHLMRLIISDSLTGQAAYTLARPWRGSSQVEFLVDKTALSACNRYDIRAEILPPIQLQEPGSWNGQVEQIAGAYYNIDAAVYTTQPLDFLVNATLSTVEGVEQATAYEDLSGCGITSPSISVTNVAETDASISINIGTAYQQQDIELQAQPTDSNGSYQAVNGSGGIGVVTTTSPTKSTINYNLSDLVQEAARQECTYYKVRSRRTNVVGDIDYQSITGNTSSAWAEQRFRTNCPTDNSQQILTTAFVTVERTVDLDQVSIVGTRTPAVSLDLEQVSIVGSRVVPLTVDLNQVSIIGSRVVATTLDMDQVTVVGSRVLATTVDLDQVSIIGTYVEPFTGLIGVEVVTPVEYNIVLDGSLTATGLGNPNPRDNLPLPIESPTPAVAINQIDVPVTLTASGLASSTSTFSVPVTLTASGLASSTSTFSVPVTLTASGLASSTSTFTVPVTLTASGLASSTSTFTVPVTLTASGLASSTVDINVPVTLTASGLGAPENNTTAISPQVLTVTVGELKVTGIGPEDTVAIPPQPSNVPADITVNVGQLTISGLGPIDTPDEEPTLVVDTNASIAAILDETPNRKPTVKLMRVISMRNAQNNPFDQGGLRRLFAPATVQPANNQAPAAPVSPPPMMMGGCPLNAALTLQGGATPFFRFDNQTIIIGSGGAQTIGSDGGAGVTGDNAIRIETNLDNDQVGVVSIEAGFTFVSGDAPGTLTHNTSYTMLLRRNADSSEFEVTFNFEIIPIDPFAINVNALSGRQCVAGGPA